MWVVSLGSHLLLWILAKPPWNSQSLQYILVFPQTITLLTYVEMQAPLWSASKPSFAGFHPLKAWGIAGLHLTPPEARLCWSLSGEQQWTCQETSQKGGGEGPGVRPAGVRQARGAGAIHLNSLLRVQVQRDLCLQGCLRQPQGRGEVI